MSVKSIREYHAKKILQSNFSTDLGIQGVLVDPKVSAAHHEKRTHLTKRSKDLSRRPKYPAPSPKLPKPPHTPPRTP